MEAKMLEIKVALAAFFTTLGTLLGWKGVMAVVWVVMMGLDYLSGSMAARKNSEWDSSVARAGLWHKGGMILVVLVAWIFDGVLVVMSARIPYIQIQWPGVMFPLVLAWYILTEAGSVLENAVKLGAVVPDWLTRGLKITLKSVDKAGDEAAKEE